MPSPTFWKMCGRVLNGASPSQEAPSPPIWVKRLVSRSIHWTMKWQPMPASAFEPFGHVGRAAVRAPGAEIGQPRQSRYVTRCGLLGPPQLLQTRTQRRVVTPLQQPRGNRDRDLVRGQVALARQQRRAGQVELALDPGSVRQMVEQLLGLALDQPALLLDHEDPLEPAQRPLQAHGLQRPDHAHLVDQEAQLAGAGLVDLQIVQGGDDVEPGLAGGHDAEPGALAAQRHPVEPVGTSESAGGVELVGVDAGLLRQGHALTEPVVGPADVEPAQRRGEILGQADLGQRRIDRDRGRALDRVVDAFQRHPAAGEARHGDAEQAVLQDLLHAGRIERRHQRVDHGVLALVRRGARFADMVVAEQHQHAAMLGRPEQVAVADRIARAVDAGALGVPDREHAVVAALAVEADLLGAGAGRGRQVLVDRGSVHDVVGVEVDPRPLQLLVVGPERRAAVAGDEARRVQARREVALALHQRQPHQRLDAGDEDPPRADGVLVVEGDRAQLRHLPTSL